MKMISFLLIILVLILTSCTTLTQLSEEIPVQEQRIATKQEELNNLEEHQRILEQEKSSLLAELDNRKMNLNELHARLANLREKNSQLRTLTTQQQNKQKSFETKTQQYMQEISNLKANNNLPDTEKNERIKQLKEEIKTYLKMGL